MCGWHLNTHKSSDTLESIAYRSLEAAASRHAVAKASAVGDEASRLEAKQMLMGNADDGQVQFTYAIPHEPDALLYFALSPDDQYDEVAEYD